MITETQELSDRVLHISRHPWKLIIITAAGSLCVLLFALASSISMKIPIGTFTRDPLQIVNAPFYTGIVSNIGILFWCSTAAICLFSFNFISGSQKSSFLLISGILTLFLLFDDFFLFHEVIYRNYLHIPQKIVFGLYSAAIVYLLFRFRKIILETEFMILYLAVMLFFVSGIVDAIPKNILPFHHLFEDGPKFMGIVFWFVYYLRTSFVFLRSEKI